jgi:TolB-like protein/Tfp pilus assembly protein PilF/tRNA A-37 threonylcarbamoyl transferase component Bud32
MGTRDEIGPPAGSVSQVPPLSPEAERWHRVKAVFLGVIDVSESERSLLVAEACGDDAALRDEVLSLLASERAAAGFGERPAVEVLGAEALIDPPAVRRLEPGTLLGAYEVTGFLSAGGMGEVYRARHTVLGRQVAIKTLNAELADPLAKRRLIREARHASLLSHPNICTIHEVGEAGDTPFIVMEFVDGQPLSEIVRMALPALDDALACGIQIADALEHAHDRGIVHRDLKSSNVVVDPIGRPIVLDFGLARRAVREHGAAPADSTVTVDGALAGTLSHMAPEVLTGGQADARSDVWSLGVLLYELTTGTLPFQGRTPFETSSAILNEPPRPVPRRVPLAVRLVIERCLVKDPGARYQRAAEVRDALDAIRRRRAWPLVGRLLVSARRRTLYAVATAAILAVLLLIGANRLREHFGGVPGGRISTLALLPLENATGDPGAQYYADGLTEGLIGQLGTLGDIRITSPASAARVGATAATRAEAARQLGADAIVEGRLRQASGRIAIDIRLIEPSRGRVLWSDTYERSSRQVLALQADVVRALAAATRLALRPGARDQLAAVRAVNPGAYEEYLKGRYEYNRRTAESLQLAIEHFARATELDPTYAPPYAALADCYNQFGTLMLGTKSPREFRPRAVTAAIRALQIDPASAEAHAALGYARHYDWQFDEAEREFKRAIELNPSYAFARIWYANLLMSRDRMDEALEQVYAAREIDPFSLIINTNLGWILSAAGRPEDAIAHLTRTLELDSTYFHAHWRLADALMDVGRYPEAYAHAQRTVALSGRAPLTLGLLAGVTKALGRTDEVRAILAELLERARTGYVPPPTIASVHLLLGDVDGAMPWVERAFEERANWVVYVTSPSAAGPLQRDPRFQALVARSGLR